VIALNSRQIKAMDRRLSGERGDRIREKKMIWNRCNPLKSPESDDKTKEIQGLFLWFCHGLAWKKTRAKAIPASPRHTYFVAT
jgi:hypothetical protein